MKGASVIAEPSDASLEVRANFIESEIQRLKGEIDQLRFRVRGIKSQRRPLERAVAGENLRLQYFKFVHWLRTPSKLFEVWRVALVLVVPCSFAAITFLLIDSIFGSRDHAIILACLLGFAGFALLLTVLNYPDNSLLLNKILGAEHRVASAKTRLAQQTATDGLFSVKVQLAGTSRQLRDRKQELHKIQREQKRRLREEIKSGRYLRKQLLQRDWPRLRGYDWEAYLVEVFDALGAKVVRTGKCGDQGCDLVVQFLGRKIAVQAKGYDEFNIVNNKAVQEAYTGMAFHGCNACAGVTNSTFRQSARDVAAKTGCVLIGYNEFPDFVMGKIRL